MRTGKIARLPDSIRQQLNSRLLDAESGPALLDWLNSLPEVQTVLAAEFEGRAINPTNLSEWRNGGYRDWQVRHDALNFLGSLRDHDALGHEALPQLDPEQLAHWVILQFAAATQALESDPASPNSRWSRLHELCADVARLRRTQLLGQHLELERQWLALEQTKTRDQKEKEFWAWTKRPDIQDRLRPKTKSGSLSTLDFLKLLSPLEESAPRPASRAKSSQPKRKSKKKPAAHAPAGSGKIKPN